MLGDILAARILGPAVFGLYAIGWTLFRLVETIAPIGLDRAVLRFAPGHLLDDDRPAFQRVVLQSIGISLFSGIIFGGTFFALATWLANDIFNKPELAGIFKYFSLAFPLASLLPVVAAITRSHRSVKYAVLIQEFAQPLSALTLLGFFYFAGGRLEAVIFSDIFSYAVAIVLGAVFIHRLFPFVFSAAAVGLGQIAPLLRFSIPMALGGTFSLLIYWMDRLFVGYFRTETETGVYQAASQISLLFAVILSGLGTILVPMFTAFHHQGDRKRLQEAYRIGNKWGLYLGLPALIVLFLSPQRSLVLLYGDAYQDGWTPLLILLLGQAVNLATGASAPLLVMGGGQRSWFTVTALVFFLGVGLNLWLVPLYGVTGAAIAATVALCVMFISILLIVRSMFGFWPYDPRYLKGLWAALFAGVAVWLVGLTSLSDVPILIVQAAAAILVFGGTLILLGLDDEDRVFLSVIQKKIISMTASIYGR